MFTAARMLLGWTLIGLGVWLAFKDWPQWNGLALISLCSIGGILIELRALRARLRRPFFPAHSGRAARVFQIAIYVILQALILALVAVSMWPSAFGNPGGPVFLALLAVVVIFAMIYRKLSDPGPPPNQTS